MREFLDLLKLKQGQRGKDMVRERAFWGRNFLETAIK
jgi:hypothetical protein